MPAESSLGSLTHFSRVFLSKILEHIWQVIEDTSLPTQELVEFSTVIVLGLTASLVAVVIASLS